MGYCGYIPNLGMQEASKHLLAVHLKIQRAQLHYMHTMCISQQLTAQRTPV